MYSQVVKGEHQKYDHWLTYVYSSGDEAQKYLEEAEEARTGNF
jgi:hypothetical protein